MELPVNTPNSDELTKCLRTDKIINDALNEANKRRAAYYDQKIMDELLRW